MTAIITDLKSEPELAGPWTISHQTPAPVARPEHTFDFSKPTDNLREIDSFYYFHDALLSWDPVVVRAIREFDPTIIPVFIKRVYLWPTGGQAVLTYFAILREKYPTVHPREPFKLERCGCAEHRHLWPNIEEVVFGADPPVPGWPEAFMPCDMRMAKRLQRIFWITDQPAEKLAKSMLEGQAARKAAAEAALQSSFNDRLDDEWNHLMSTVSSMSDQEIATMHHPRQESKPFVSLSSPAPSEPASPVQGA